LARKRVWLSWLPEEPSPTDIQGVLSLLAKSGLEVDGSPWNRDVDKVGWLDTAGVLADGGRADVWLIVGRAEDYAAPAVRYGLSMAQVMLRAKRDAPLAVVCAGIDAAPVADQLPVLLQRADVLGPPTTVWGAKTIAAAMRTRATAAAEPFRVSVIAHASLGQWFEVGPVDGAWEGAVFGVDGGEITHHGVGPSGLLPEHCTLEYPSMGLRIDAGGLEFTCCSIKNRLEPGTSYYVRATGAPHNILFGEHPEQDEAEVRILDLV
jgi:hypothetical protein